MTGPSRILYRWLLTTTYDFRAKRLGFNVVKLHSNGVDRSYVGECMAGIIGDSSREVDEDGQKKE